LTRPRLSRHPGVAFFYPERGRPARIGAAAPKSHRLELTFRWVSLPASLRANAGGTPALRVGGTSAAREESSYEAIPALG
jgi:hypothetical protein